MSVKMVEGEMIVHRRREIFEKLNAATAAYRKAHRKHFTDEATIHAVASDPEWNQVVQALIKMCVEEYNTTFFKGVLYERLTESKCKLRVYYRDHPVGTGMFDDRSVAHGVGISVQRSMNGVPTYATKGTGTAPVGAVGAPNGASGASGICTIDFSLLPSQIVARMRYILENETLPKFAQSSVFILAMMDQLERAIILIFLYLWGVPTPSIRQYACAYQTFFGTGFHLTRGEEDGEAEEDDDTVEEEIWHMGFRWTQNSCYIDVLLMCILGSSATYARNVIFNTDVKRVQYTSHHICESDLPSERIREIAASTQEIMKNYYRDIFGGGLVASSGLKAGVPQKVDTCSTLRNVLFECLPSMKENGRWDYYIADRVYTLLTEFFPALQYDVLAENVQVFARPDGTLTVHRAPPVVQRSGTHLFANFVVDTTKAEGSDTIVTWETANSPLLVFINGGTPPMRNFGSTKTEVVKVGDETLHIYKRRAFGEYILDRRYRMFGVVFLVDGNHYTAAVRIRDVWYKYDDMGPRFTRIGGLPDDTFVATARNTPAMYFYEKVV